MRERRWPFSSSEATGSADVAHEVWLVRSKTPLSVQQVEDMLRQPHMLADLALVLGLVTRLILGLSDS